MDLTVNSKKNENAVLPRSPFAPLLEASSSSRKRAKYESIWDVCSEDVTKEIDQFLDTPGDEEDDSRPDRVNNLPLTMSLSPSNPPDNWEALCEDE